MPPDTTMDPQNACEEGLQSESPRLPFPTEGAKTVREMIGTLDSFPQHGDSRRLDHYAFTIEGYAEPFGIVHKDIQEDIPWPGCWKINDKPRTLHLMARNRDDAGRLLDDTIEGIREKGRIKGLGKRKKRALFTIKFENGHHIRDKYVCHIDVAGWQIFGLIAFGVGVIGRESGQYWFQQRSWRREMHPGKLDMMAGGGIEDDEEPWGAAIREAEEEAGVPRAYSGEHLQPCGTVSYHLAWSHLNKPGSFPHVIHLFEIEVSDIPVKNDGEVEGFERMAENQVLDELYLGRFKPILFMQLASYLSGKGALDIDKDLVPRMHRRLVEDGAWTSDA
ncbi:uncharacterized protein DNG_03940 [Cephalotrichum gorgonifer]|uniref:Nudix hydrolase domain-containing protein n=1 Tax=Cephalotrichum gorgonifer TaxID=2041049 RepID=A0AAE8MXI4_9PEZI|nr:uncharacterized protein DNG_03940 [Cephalotrichum gorgonifer]